MSGKLVRRESDTKITGVCELLVATLELTQPLFVYFCIGFYLWSWLTHSHLYHTIYRHSK